MSDQPLKSTLKDVPNGVFFVSNQGHDHKDLLGIVIG